MCEFAVEVQRKMHLQDVIFWSIVVGVLPSTTKAVGNWPIVVTGASFDVASTCGASI